MNFYVYVKVFCSKRRKCILYFDIKLLHICISVLSVAFVILSFIFDDQHVCCLFWKVDRMYSAIEIRKYLKSSTLIGKEGVKGGRWERGREERKE